MQNFFLNKKNIEKFFFVTFSIVPISIILGPSISLLNIFLIIFIFIIYASYQKNLIPWSNSTVRLLFILYLYLIFNSLISLDFKMSANRNFGFLRIIIFFIAINYFFFRYKKFFKAFHLWIIIIFLLAVDTYFERIFGTNILGYGGIDSTYGNRIVSFFKDEPIVGSYLNGFYFLILGYCSLNFKNFSLQNKLIFLFLFLFLFIAILVTGERTNSIKAFIGIIIFFTLNNNILIKIKIYFFIAFTILLFLIYSNSSYLQFRYGEQLIKPLLLKNDSQIQEYGEGYFLKENIYFNLYKSGFRMFQDYPIFGVGNKNYRIASCNEKYNPKLDDPEIGKALVRARYLCITHPHQIYIEMLSEHGLFGTIIMLSIFFTFFFKILMNIFLTKNSLQLGCLIYLIVIFMPILPGGSFYSDFNITLFFINFSIMYACDKNTNIFSQKKNN